MNNMCITGYFVESTELTKEEKVKELEIEHYHIERYPDGDVTGMWVGTQEEYDEIVRDLREDNGTVYIIMDF